MQRNAMETNMELRRAEQVRINRLQAQSEDIAYRLQAAQDQALLAEYYGCVFHACFMIATALDNAFTGIPLLATLTPPLPRLEDAQSRSALVG